MAKADNTAKTRLERALHQLELAKTSRELDYGATPFVIAAIYMIQAALEKQDR